MLRISARARLLSRLVLALLLLQVGCARRLLDLDGKPIVLGRWTSFLASNQDAAWLAKPGEHYRLSARWTGGQAHLCLYSGELEAPEFEFEDAKQLTKSCPPQGPDGLSVAELQVPPDANAVWYFLNPEGDVSRPLDLRIDRD